MDKKREGASAILMCQEFSFIGRGLWSINEVMIMSSDNL